MKFFLGILLLFLPVTVFAYEPTQTHPGITEQAVEFYNLFENKKIQDKEKELIIRGSTEEDMPVSRATNHFYDPIRNIGIDGGRTTKEWALSDLELNEYSWGKALEAYAKGDEDTAYVALGHILHLVADMAVPDHTRNDQHLPFLSEEHGGGSPYEEWGESSKNRQTMHGLALGLKSKGGTIKTFSKIEDYFDFLANYSNRNFFSRDTIESKVYFEPKIIKYNKGYGYGVDRLTDTEVALVKKIEDQGTAKDVLTYDHDYLILSSYFDRLSKQYVPVGAGVIKLFFQEGESARLAYQEDLRLQQEAEMKANAELAQAISQKGFFGLLWTGAGYLVIDNIVDPIANRVVLPIYGRVSNSAHLLAEAVSPVPSVAGFATVATAVATKNGVIAAGEWTANKAAQGIIIVQQTARDVFSIQTPPPSIPLPPPAPQIVITPSNNHTPPQVMIVPAGAFQASQSSLESGSMPSLVFVGAQNQVLSFGGSSPYQALAVADEVEPVHEEAPVVIVETPGAPLSLPAPTLTVPECAYSLATDGCLLATMSVRFEWSSVAGADHYEISQNGTIATTTDTFTDIIVRDFSQYTLIVSAVDANGLTSATSSQTVFVATIPVAINEIAWMGTNASANDEWFEIKNNTPYTIDLTQWELNAKDGTPHVQLAGTIAPRGYLIFERTDDTNVSDVEAHQIYTGALGNAGEQINLSYASTTLDQTPEIADGAWAAGDNGSSTTTKKTMERYSSREDGSNPMNWGTNLGYVKNGTDADGGAISGTPGEQNSVSTLINRGEDITEDFTLTADEERYVLARGTNVSASSTLTIEPGVNIVFLQEQGSGNEGRFYGRGAIEALGEKENPITFEGSDGYPDASIRFRNTSATSTFEYTHFENIHGIETENGSVHISNSEFVSTEGVSIEGDGASLIIENTVFASSTDTSIRVCCGASATVSSSTITNQLDDYGIIVYGGNLVVVSTTIENIPGRHGLGIYATHSVLSVSSSTIRNVKNEAISLDDSVATITNTVIEAGELNTGSNGIEIYGGETTISQSTISGFSGEYCTGVSIEDTETPVAITGGEITGNSIGVGVDNAGDVVLTDVSIHDNGDGPEDDVVIW